MSVSLAKADESTRTEGQSRCIVRVCIREHSCGDSKFGFILCFTLAGVVNEYAVPT